MVEKYCCFSNINVGILVSVVCWRFIGVFFKDGVKVVDVFFSLFFLFNGIIGFVILIYL